MSREVRREIRLVEYEDGQWSATDEEADVTVEGERWEDAFLQLGLRSASTSTIDQEAAEMSAEELGDAVDDIVGDVESIANAPEDVDENEVDDADDSRA
ncbi:hypothetical protein [Halorussus halobius]|uniref:hypothetical protein n=1 Tax=Halorussus halobius TaxID=1710537 RepID=UPI001091A835|nr:hypothetical protein [Halorussus halobius]